MTSKLIQFLEHKALSIRIDSLKATTQAASGHPTSSLSAADLVAVLFFHILKYDYKNPAYHNNDRFILSKGHAVPALYAALHQLGVITEEQLLSYRRIDSDFEGHPTPRLAFNEAATGSLGQGLGVGLGMALNARHDKLPYKTYVLMGDGEVAEGSVWEAAELAAHEHADNLVAILDCNRLGQSDEALHGHHVERYAKKFEAFGWETVIVDGHDIAKIIEVFEYCAHVKGQPSIILAKTVKGYGLDGIENELGFHGKPFKKDELPAVIEKLQKRFHAVATYQTTEIFKAQAPEQINLQQSNRGLNLMQGELKGQKISTRKVFGQALAALGFQDDRIFALDADVKNSTFTELFEKEHKDRFIQCYIAEQNMVSVAAGLALRGKIPFASTFACFFSRAYDQIRMAGIGRVPLRLCGSHSGVSIGQDGPSQMGLEDIGMLRAIPNSIVLWPSDGVCAHALVKQMVAYSDGVSYMKTNRSDMPILYDSTEEFVIGGSKVLRSSGNDKACIATAGMTVYEALAAYEQLKSKGVSVSIVDLYSIKPLDTSTLLSLAATSGNTIITVEDHYPQGGLGEAVVSELRNTGITIVSLAVEKLPRSGQPEELMRFEEIDAQAIVRTVENLK